MPSVMVTGADRGLGLEFARQYLTAGWQVYAACRDPNSASELRRLAERERPQSADQMALASPTLRVSRRMKRNSKGKLLTFSSTMLASSGTRGQTIGSIDY